MYIHLTKFLNCGIFKRLGASIYTPYEFTKIKKYKKITCIQLPFNLIDHRWVKILNKKNKKFKFFVRSIFLRGNLKNREISFNKKINNPQIINQHLRKICYEFKKNNFFELTIAYLKSFVGINYFVVGVQNSKHIQNLINLFKVKPLKKSQKQKLIRIIQSNFDARQSDLRNWN